MKTLLCKVCLFIIVIVYSFTAMAQSDSLKIDSLKKILLTQKEDTNKVKTLTALADMFLQKDEYANVIQYANEALSLSEKINFIKGKVSAYIDIGFFWGNQFNYPEERKNLTSALKLREKLGDQNGIAFIYILIAGTYNSEYNYAESLKNIYSALKIYSRLENKRGIAQCDGMIGRIYYSQGTMTMH